MKRTVMVDGSVTASEHAEAAPLQMVSSDASGTLPLPLQPVVPKSFDVLLGRGRWYASHAGNRRLQIFINMFLERYQTSQSRPEKTHITNEILHMIKTCGKQPGRFLKFEEDISGWVEVNDEVARLKISQAMRYSIRAPQEGLIPQTHNVKICYRLIRKWGLLPHVVN
jgi:hypothetical protein